MDNFYHTLDLCKLVWGCKILVLTPFALSVYDVYIVMDHGVELSANTPPLIVILCFGDADGILC